MRLCTPSEMRTIEAQAGIPENKLMDNAGFAAAQEIADRYMAEIKRGGIAIVCGPGHNGGDGMVVARYLSGADISPIQIFSAEQSLGNPSTFGVIVDALYGIGLNRGLKGEKIERQIAQINAAGVPVVSLDVPSGLDAAKGVAEGAAVKAALTLTFEIPKIGCFTAKGSELTGEIKVLPIGIPKRVVARDARTYRLLTERLARRLLPSRKISANKSTFGHLVVCAGRPGYWGAGVLATQAGFRVGSGYVTWAAQAAPVEELKFHPEVMTSTLDEILSSDKKYTAFVVGPGLGTDESIENLIEGLAKRKIATVLDADALTVLAKHPMSLPANWILTPHSGEMARLLGISAAEVESNRFACAQRAAEKFGCLVLLKGYRTIVASKARSVLIDAGNPALAKAGTGDVLAGLIGGLLAQGLSSGKAATLGAFIHGQLADRWVESGKDVASLVASDLAEALPHLLHDLRGSR